MNVKPDLEELVLAAADGDDRAWERLVHRLMPLVVSVIGEYELEGTDAAEVNQTVWLRVVEWLTHLRRPAALPSWITTTTRRECERVLRTGRRERPAGLYDDLVGTSAATAGTRAPDDEAIREERCRALRAGFAQLPLRCQELLTMLIGDPRLSYRDVVARTGMSIGSVGPTHRRCLDKLRATPPVAAHLGRRREYQR
jgi:RNA polymerase sigma factor (sigma-70 family)